MGSKSDFNLIDLERQNNVFMDSSSVVVIRQVF